MDPHPTPFPGKLRPSANSKKDKGGGKFSKEPSRLATIASRPRHGSQQDRVFGTVRSTNTTVGKPPQEPTKVFKQPKHSVTSKKLPSKTGAKVELRKETAGSSRDDVEDAATKPKSEPRKTSVRFQDQRPEEKRSGEGVAEDGPRTPMSSIKPTVLLGTPFYSAKCCSKCRFDRLESAPYWLNQIKLAESVGKHVVSAAFFRLALECNAEPIRSLKSEIKRYMARHRSLHIVTVWKELCGDYGLLNEDLGVGGIVVDPLAASVGEKEDSVSVVEKGVSGDRTDECLRSGFGGIPQSDSSGNSTKGADSTFVDLNGNTEENPSAAVIGEGTHEDVNKPAVSFSEDNLMIVENPSVDSTPVELNSHTWENPSADSTPLELNSNTWENPSTDSTPLELNSDTWENPSVDSSHVELNSDTWGNPRVDSTHVELVGNTGENPSADSTPVELNSDAGENPSADSTPVELDGNTGENPSADSTPVELNSNTGENPSADSTPVELNSDTWENPSADSTPVELNSNAGENPSADFTPVELDGDTGENPSADSTPVELNSDTWENPNADSTPVELNSITGENPSADSTPVELDGNAGENPSTDSTHVKLDGNTWENPSTDSTHVKLDGNTWENPSANSTTVEQNNNAGENPSAAAQNGEGAKKVVNKPTVGFSEDSLMVEKTDGSSVVNESANEDSSSVVVTPGENFFLEKSERSSGGSPKGSSSLRKKVHPRNLADTSNKTSSTSQAASGSCGERVGKSKDEPRRNQKSKEAAKKNRKGRAKSPRWV